jgi:hypothetical protein
MLELRASFDIVISVADPEWLFRILITNKKIFVAKTLRIIVLFIQKKNLTLCYQKYGLGSEIRDPEKTYSGSWAKKSPDL